MLPVNSRKVWIPNNAEAAINRACQLIEELGAGEVVGGMVDVYAGCKTSRCSIPFEPDRINALLGTDISADADAGLFQKDRSWIRRGNK